MDRAHEGGKIRALAPANGHEPIVPPKKSRREPWDYDKEKYQRRHAVRQLFRRVCTRYDKTDSSLLASIQFAFIASWLKGCQHAPVRTIHFTACRICHLLPPEDKSRRYWRIDLGKTVPAHVF
jgi:hypothetical protein